MTPNQIKREKEIWRSTRRMNQRYKKATAAQRRVMISKDVLEQLKNKRYEACSGVWANFGDLTCDLQGEVQLQRLLHEKPRHISCSVCGIGSLFLSAVRFRNDYIVNFSNHGTDAHAFDLLKEFSESQRRLIEIAFERGEGACSAFTQKERFAAEWSEFIPCGKDTPRNRIEFIMKNIIRNKGTFKPTEL